MLVIIGHTLYGHGDEPVMALHGWFGDHSAFDPLLPWLDTETFTYAFMDYRGYGESKALTGEYSMREIAADALALADRLGWRRFHLVGHSMGGMAMQRIAADAPARVKSLVGITPVPACGVPFDEPTWAVFTGAADNDDHRRAIIDLTTGNRLCRRWLDWMTQRSREVSARDAFAAYLYAWAKTDFAAAVQGLDIPLLALVGAADQAITAAVINNTFLAWYPKATLRVIDNAGHYPMQETPVYLATVLEEFLRRQTGGG